MSGWLMPPKMPSRTAANGRSLSKTWRRSGTSSTCSDAMWMPLWPEERIAAQATPMVKARVPRIGARVSAGQRLGDEAGSAHRVGNKRRVRSADRFGDGAHAVGHESLRVRRDSVVVLRHQEPGGLGPPPG